jgi:lactate permease
VNDLPLDPLRWGLAILPLVLLLVLLVGLRWKAPEAGPIGMFIAAAVALTAFEAPLETVVVAAGKGIWDAVFVLLVVWPALLLYRVVDRAGGFEALHEGIQHFSRNELFLVLAFGWVFASFLQGIAGFGVPVAVVAPLLVGLGVRPIQAVVIPLIGHAWGNLFGTLAVAWLATTRVVDLDDETATAIQTAALLWLPNLTAGLAVAWIYGRMAAVTHALPLVILVSLIHGGGQLLIAGFNPVLAAFVPATLALVVLYGLSHWKRYSEPEEGIDERPAMKDRDSSEEDLGPEPVMGLGMALMPYIVLIGLTLAILLVPPVEEALEQVEIGPPFPEVQAGFGEVVEEEDPYSPFAPLTHPGMFLFAAAVVAWLVYRRRGKYRRWDERADTEPILAGVVKDAVPASVAIAAFLAMSKIMDDTLQTDVLAVGVGEVAPPIAYAFIASAIGGIGSFMTSSNTASNILFAPLQQQTAAALALPESSIIAAQNAGGAIGNSVAPANVVLGTGTAGIVGEEGSVLRRVLPWAGGTLLLVGLAVVALSLVGGIGNGG